MHGAAGIPARFVSGYLCSDGINVAPSHAWIDVWLVTERGWFSLDVTHVETARVRHCRLAVGRDYLDAAPVRAARRGGGCETVAVTVRITGARPRPSRRPVERW